MFGRTASAESLWSAWRPWGHVVAVTYLAVDVPSTRLVTRGWACTLGGAPNADLPSTDTFERSSGPRSARVVAEVPHTCMDPT